MSSAAPDSAGLFVLGATHHTTPLAVREKLTLSADAATALHADLAAIPGLREFTLLNTCNRIEFYGVAETPAASAAVQSAFCRRQQFPEDEFARLRLALSGRATVQHLLEVASGLDSQMLGETEIFGQVKDAYATAQTRGSTGPVLNRVFQKAFQAAKHVRTHTAITEGQISVANVAVDLAQNIFGDLSSTRVLLVGAGDIGEKTARAFQSRSAGTIAVTSRRLESAMELSNSLGAFALPFWLMPVKLAEFDIVVCATAAPTAVVTAAAVAATLRRRSARPLFFIDLALPRDVEAEVAKLQNVYLYNLDDLAKITDENRAARTAEIVKCRHLLTERATVLWSQVAPQVPATAALSAAPDPAAHIPI